MKIEKKVLIRNDEKLKYPFHPVANIFPLMGEAELHILKEDIKHNGLLESIWLHGGQVVDGRNRYLACNELGIKPRFRKYNGNGNLIDFVISLNLKRRHLSKSQCAMVAVDTLEYYEKEAKERQRLSKGRGKKGKGVAGNSTGFGKSRDMAAKTFGVSGRLIQTAKKIIREHPEIAEEIRSGKRSITQSIFNNDEHHEDDKTKILKSIHQTLKELNLDELERIMKYIESKNF